MEYFDWRPPYLSCCRMVGFADELTAAEGQGLKAGVEDFDEKRVDSERVWNAFQAWISLLDLTRVQVPLSR